MRILVLVCLLTSTAFATERSIFSDEAAPAPSGRVRTLPYPDTPNWNLEGNLFIGGAVPANPPGTIKDGGGVAMGGDAKLRYESTGRKVLLYGELMGEGFNNGNSSDRDIEFSQFYINTGLMLGSRSVKWLTPLNLNLSRDIFSNEQIAVRYAFSGLFVRFLNDQEGEDRLHQLLEAVTSFVVARLDYIENYDARNCAPGFPCEPQNYADGRTVLGLHAALKYEIEKRGWGSEVQLELLQDISPGYSKANVKLTGFKQLSGELKNLRPFLQLAGTLDHDDTDPAAETQGSVRVFGGIGGRFGL